MTTEVIINRVYLGTDPEEYLTIQGTKNQVLKVLRELLGVVRLRRLSSKEDPDTPDALLYKVHGLPWTIKVVLDTDY